MGAVEGESREDRVVGQEEESLPRRQHRLPLPVVLIAAALVRIPFVLLPPAFSDDVHRHRWDGRVLAAGIDPYRYAPADPRLARLVDADARKINHPRVPTVYGPAAEGLLGLLALSPAKASLVSIKALAAGFDVAAVAALWSLGAVYGAGTLPALAYAVHPLAVIETAGDGHLDGMAVALLLASLAALHAARGRTGAAIFGAATLVKVTPLAAAPALFRSAGRMGGAIALGVMALGYLPFRASGGPWRGLATYAERWEANGVLYPDLVRLLDRTHAAARAKEAFAGLKALLGHPAFLDRFWGLFYTGFLARALLGLLFLAGAWTILRREPDVARAAGLLLALLLVVSPTLHPWYLLNVLPFALLFGWASVGWVAGAVPLAHLARTWPHPDVIRAIEYLPAVVLYATVDRRRGR